jgi:hypothetical protein
VTPIIAGAGLEVQDRAGYLAFRHRVDQAISRDILVARRPGVAMLWAWQLDQRTAP